MFSIIVATLQTAMLITVFITLPTLFLLRLYIISRNKLSLKVKLLVLFLPFSSGYYCFLSKDKQHKGYNVLVVVFTIIALIGILFTLYQRVIPSY